MLKTVISPQKQKLESLPQAIEEWMDAVRTYEKRRDAAGNRTSIPDQIKTAALEAMLPPDLESHVQLNRARVIRRSCLGGYKHQVHEGRYYLQERPRGMKSWEHAQYQSLSEESYTVEGPMCVCVDHLHRCKTSLFG